MHEITADYQEPLLDREKLRQDFKILSQSVQKNPLIYLDNAATTQKPSCVLSALLDYYQHDNANIHRGIHTLSMRATKAYENARRLIQELINAKDASEIIFTRGTTEGINLVAQTFGQCYLHPGDEIILSEMEHHSNIVPWQLIAEKQGAKIKVIPISDEGELNMPAFQALLTDKTKLVAITHVSNAIGTINPIEEIIAIAHSHAIPVLIDGAQAIAHMEVDVQALDCDFYVFSGHKMYAPTGIGVLYGKSKWLDTLPPYQGGGDMISEVSFEKTHYNKLPYKFEAGTPNIAGVIGLGAAVLYLTSIGMVAITEHEGALLRYATERLNAIDGLKMIGCSKRKTAVISFLMDDIHPHDIGTVLDYEGIAIRAGHHCAMPLMAKFNVPATARISLGIYNTFEEIEALVCALLKLKKIFR
jgi:cysteine desulfurase / selenocysteine lyase